jgi:hypothetical protein
MRRQRKWQGSRRASKRFTAALAQAFIQRLTPSEKVYLAEQLKWGIGPGHGSTAMETKFTNSQGTGICDVLGAPAFHDTDARRNPAGLPDGVAVVGRTLVLAEFKPEHGAPNPAQRRWLEALAKVRYVWSGVVRPSEWAEFVDSLVAMDAEGESEEGTEIPEDWPTKP